MTSHTPFPVQQYKFLEGAGIVLLQTSRFDEDNYRSYLFREPIRVLSATELDEVPGVFSQIEQALAHGEYVAGFVSYECGEHFERLGRRPTMGAPLIWFGVYRRPYVFDHRNGVFDRELTTSALSEEGARRQGRRRYGSAFCVQNPRLGISESEYARKIEAIRDYIRAGDTYQVNFTDRLLFDFAGSPVALFAALQERQRAAYSAYIDAGVTVIPCLSGDGRHKGGAHAGRVQILSLSPELFFRIRDGRIVTRPMKGTVHRGRTETEDAALTEWLRNDAKNRAENVMIVDLLRNDLGRICEFGSVQVDELFAVEQYETLFQMTSSVSGKLRPRLRYYDIFRSIFPCGSVTGAPKIRSMQLIRELERTPRGVYTGAIGFVSPQGEAEFNVAIRTVVLRDGAGAMGVGSGIVFDSTAQDEYRECLLKAEFLSGSCKEENSHIVTKPFAIPTKLRSPECPAKNCARDFQLIESILWNDTYLLLPLHLDRLERSALHFGFVFEREQILARLARNQELLQQGLRYKVRLLLDEAGAAIIENTSVAESAKIGRVALSEMRTSSGDPFLLHKTTRRESYDRMFAQARERGYEDVLFLNERGEVTEGAISNIFLEIGGRLYTPPIEAGVLPGVYRRHMLETTSTAAEKSLSASDLRTADAIYICNAIRGLRQVELDDTVCLHLDRCSR